MSNVLRLAFDRDSLTEAQADEKLEACAEVLTAQQEALHAAATLIARWRGMLPQHGPQVANEMTTLLTILTSEVSAATH